MNYNAIEIDEYVAWVHYRNRGTFPRHAMKALVLDKRKIHKFGRANQTGEVLLEDDNGSSLWISAYNVIDFWDRYEEERNALYAEQMRLDAEREERLRLQREENERLESQRREAEQLIRNRIALALGIPVDAIISVSSWQISIKRDVVERMIPYD